MSLNGLFNSQFPLTIDGTTSLDASSITIDGQNIDLSNLVPYTGANQTVDLGSQIIKSTHTATTNPELVNKGQIDNIISNLSIAIAGSFLSKTSLTSQTVAGPVTYSNTLTADNLVVPATKQANLGTVVEVGINHKQATNDASVTVGQYFGTITSSLGVYESTSSTDMGTLVLGSALTVGQRYRVYINVLGSDTQATAVGLYESSDGTSLNVAHVLESFPANSTLFRVIDFTYTASEPYAILVLFTAGGGATLKWFGLETYAVGVELEKVTMPLLTADRVAVLNGNKQLVSSGISITKLDYLDNVSSDIQTQLNGKLNLSGSNANQNIVLGSYKVQSTATPTVNSDYTTKLYVDNEIVGAGSLYLLKTGGTMTGDIVMGSNKITSTATPATDDTLTRKGYVDTQDGLRVLKAGDTMTGTLVMSGNKITTSYTPVNDEDLTRKGYVDTQDGLRVLKAGDTMTGTLVMGSNKITTSYTPVNAEDLTRKGYVDTQDALKVNLAGPNTLTGINTYTSTLILSGYTASRVLQLDASKNVTTSTTTITELGYLSGTTSSVQTQLNTIAGIFASYLPLTGGTLVGNLGIGLTPRVALDVLGSILLDWSSTTHRIGMQYLASSTGYYLGMACSPNTRELFLDSQSQDTGGSGAVIIRTGAGPTERVKVDKDGQMASGVNGNTLYNLKFANSLSHIDNNAGEVYLMTAFQGHMGIQRSTTRNATTACLVLGTSGTEESEIISVKADNSGYMPMGYAASKHLFVSGPVNVVGPSPYALGIGAMATGSLTLGGAGANYGGGTGWNTNTAGLLMECLDTTEIAVHDAGARLASFMYYNGNHFTIGRDMGFGTSSLQVNSTFRAYGNAGGGPSMIFSENASVGEAYAIMHCRNNSGSGSYWFCNSSTRAVDGGPNTATLRNDVGKMRLMSNVGDGILIDSVGRVGIGTTNPGSALDVFSTGESYNSSLRVRTNWAGIELASSGSGGRTYNLTSTITGAGIGAGGFGIFDETAAAYRLSISSAGASRFYGALTVDGATVIDNTLTVNNIQQINYGSNVSFLTLKASTSVGGEYIDLEFRHNTDSTFIQSVRTAGSFRAILRFFTKSSAGAKVESVNITDLGLTSFGTFYTAGTCWSGSVTTVGDGCGTFSQNYDRFLCYADGSGTSGGYFYYNQTNAYGTISDRRIKKDFLSIAEEQSLAFIKALEPTSFCLKESEPCMRKKTDIDGNEVEEEVFPAVCSCRQDGWVAQNVLEACRVSGASKSVINHWSDYEQELSLPEEERKTLIGVSDRPILSHTVNVVKYQQKQIEAQQKHIQVLEDREAVWVEHAREQEKKIAKMEAIQKKMAKDMEKVGSLLAQLLPQ
jgi:hypothetical protein